MRVKNARTTFRLLHFESDEPDVQDDLDTNADDTSPKRLQAGWLLQWAPAIVIVAAILAWGLFRLLTRNHIRIGPDLVLLVWGGLVAVLGAVTVPRLVTLLVPKADDLQRRVLVIIGIAVCCVPLGYALFWNARDAVYRVPVRQARQIPNLAVLFGESRHDVERMLGDTFVASEYDASDSGIVLGPDNRRVTRIVVYSLPDLSTLDSRPAKRRELESTTSGGNNLLARLFPSAPRTDSDIVVYFAEGGEAVGTRLDLSMLEARALLGSATADPVLHAAGIVRTPPVSPLPLSATTTWTAGINPLPSGSRLYPDTIEYYLTLGTRTEYTAASTGAAQGSVDLGDITLMVSLGSTQQQVQSASAEQTPSTTLQTLVYTNTATATQAPGMAPQPEAQAQSFSDQQFWVIVCSETSTIEEAEAQADRFNAAWPGKNSDDPKPFTIERSGHLQGLHPGDYWVVIFNVGYRSLDTARDQIWRLGLPLQLSASAVHITKVCGDRTIAKVLP
jgi:hypothetical protein